MGNNFIKRFVMLRITYEHWMFTQYFNGLINHNSFIPVICMLQPAQSDKFTDSVYWIHNPKAI